MQDLGFCEETGVSAFPLSFLRFLFQCEQMEHSNVHTSLPKNIVWALPWWEGNVGVS